jgi:hypothetical protein
MVWDLYKETSPLTAEERVVLNMTFDRAFVPKDRLKATGKACIATHDLIEIHGFWKGVNHWQAIGNTLIGLADRKFHPQARGIALSCTSVSDMWQSPSADYLDNAWPIEVEEEA